MKFGLIFIVVTFVWYGICAFVSMIPNPMNWGIAGRFYFMLLEVTLVPLITMIIEDTIE